VELKTETPREIGAEEPKCSPSRAPPVANNVYVRYSIIRKDRQGNVTVADIQADGSVRINGKTVGTLEMHGTNLIIRRAQPSAVVHAPMATVWEHGYIEQDGDIYVDPFAVQNHAGGRKEGSFEWNGDIRIGARPIAEIDDRGNIRKGARQWGYFVGPDVDSWEARKLAVAVLLFFSGDIGF